MKIDRTWLDFAGGSGDKNLSQRRFELFIGQEMTVERNEGIAGSFAGQVDHPRNMFATCSVISDESNRKGGFAGNLNLFKDATHTWAAPDDRIFTELLSYRGPQFCQLGMKLQRRRNDMSRIESCRRLYDP